MAEGLLRSLGGGQFEAFSAGTEATQVRPLVMKAMADLGIDISKQQSKTFERYLNEPFDEVMTVCDTAAEACPLFPGAATHLPSPFWRKANTFRELLEFLLSYVATIKLAYNAFLY